jgi:hypothetical protein
MMVMPIPSAVAISMVARNPDTDADTSNMDANSGAVLSHICTGADTADMGAGSDAVCSRIRARTDASDLGACARVLGVSGAGRKQRHGKN